jgi:hypothetical protein
VSTRALDPPARTGTYAYVVLDELDRIVHVSSSLHAELGPRTGHVRWEHPPGAREIYGPCFTEARMSGPPVEAVVFYSRRLKRLTSDPQAASG